MVKLKNISVLLNHSEVKLLDNVDENEVSEAPRNISTSPILQQEPF